LNYDKIYIEEIVKNLERLGFTVYESKVFCVLFEGHLLTVSEIAEKAGIPRTSAYDILKEFVKQGICNEIETSSVTRYELIDPAIVQDKIEKEIHDSYKSRLGSLRESFDKLQPIFRTRELEAQKVDVELIRGFNKHRYSKQLELWNQSHQELLIMAKLEGRATAEADRRTIDFIKNGGKVKTLYEIRSSFRMKIGDQWKVMSTDSLIEFTTALTAEGEEVRLTDTINQFMAIFDRKAVYISLVDPTISRYNRSDIIIKNENFAKSMADYFDQEWSKAYTPEEFKQRRKDGN
jgi:sugar-specific transcriptional regulator TrmB